MPAQQGDNSWSGSILRLRIFYGTTSSPAAASIRPLNSRLGSFPWT